MRLKCTFDLVPWIISVLGNLSCNQNLKGLTLMFTNIGNLELTSQKVRINKQDQVYRNILKIWLAQEQNSQKSLGDLILDLWSFSALDWSRVVT